MSASLIIFHIVLPQDVAILRPMILLATTLPEKRVELLVSKHLISLPSGEEVNKIASELDLLKTYCEPGEDAARKLEGRSGMLIAGHESSVQPHHLTHDLFKVLPNSWLKVTPHRDSKASAFSITRPTKRPTEVTSGSPGISLWAGLPKSGSPPCTRPSARSFSSRDRPA